MPSKLAKTLGLTDTIRAIPITEPEAVHEVGLVVPAREPMTALNAAFVVEARKLAHTLDPPPMVGRIDGGCRTIGRRQGARLAVSTYLQAPADSARISTCKRE
jgi:hypothetical protein